MSTARICRAATADDILPIVVLASKFHQGHLLELGVSFDPAGFSFWLGNQIYNNPDFICMVATVDNEVVGMCGGTITRNWLCPSEAMFVEHGWFMDPDHRNGTIGIRLLKHTLKVVSEYCECITFTLLDSSPAAAEKALTREGFKPLERHFIRR